MVDKNDLVWHSGPPPHIGWWNANMCNSKILWRWWNGSAWSIPLSHWNNKKEAAECARVIEESHMAKDIQWSYYYPKNARVPRTKS